MKPSLFGNLAAEQARLGMTDADVAKIINVTRQTYGIKKRRGTFKSDEIATLCRIFDKPFEHLFETTRP